MCRACAEGGRRCPDLRRLRTVRLADLQPSARENAPAVNWGSHPSTPEELFNKHPAAVAGATIAALKKTVANEPQATIDVLASVPEGVRAHGLGFRMKSPDSLARKIASKAKATGRSPYDVNDRLTDVLRYTAVTSSSADVVDVTQTTARNLRDRGWQVEEAEHSYVPGNPYKGVHVIFRSAATGQALELQVHSEQTIAIKDEVSHELFEVLRDDDQSPHARYDADQALREAWADVPAPRGLDEFRSLGETTVRTKTYKAFNNPDEQAERHP